MDRRARGLQVSFIVRRKLAEASCSHQRAADVLGISRQRFEQILDDGTIQADDIPILEPVAPGLIAAWAARYDYAVTPERKTGSALDVLTGLAEIQAKVGALTSETAIAIPDGIDRREAARIGMACEQTRRAVNELQARVDAGVVGR